MDEIDKSAAVRRSQQEIDRSKRAAQLLSDPMLKEALTMRKATLFQEFCATDDDGQKVRESIYRQMKESYEFENYLTTVMSEGTIARQELDHLEDKDTY